MMTIFAPYYENKFYFYKYEKIYFYKHTKIYIDKIVNYDINKFYFHFNLRLKSITFVNCKKLKVPRKNKNLH